LYRRLVFFGIDQESVKEGPVWEAIDKILVDGKGDYQVDKNQFNYDRAEFGLEFGLVYDIQTVRMALVKFPGGRELLKKLCSVDPKSRGTLQEVFEVDFLQRFRAPHLVREEGITHPAGHCE
jgi:predicted NUDIX family NTP pyrophosphohydrolase